MPDRDSYTMKNGSVSVGATTPATLIVPLDPRRQKVSISNPSSANPVWLGDSTVQVGAGVRVVNQTGEERKDFLTKGAIYGVAENAAVTVYYLAENE